LSHYFQPDTPQAIEDAALKDWAKLLGRFPEAAIRDACESYLRDQPRRRPTPGDIVRRAEAQERKATGAQTGLSEAQVKAVEWAVTRGSLGRSDAIATVTKLDGPYPDWINGDELERCVYRLRKHPRFVEVEPRGEWRS